MNRFMNDRFCADKALRALVKNRNSIEKYEENLSSLSQIGEFLTKNGKVMEIHARRAIDELKRSEKGALKQKQEITTWAETLISGGKNHVSEEMIKNSLLETDQKYMLPAQTILNSPKILLIEAMKAFSKLSERARQIEADRLKAERFFETGGRIRMEDFSHAFFEYAYKLSKDEDDTEVLKILDERLSLTGRNEEEVTRIAAEEESEILMRFQNLSGLMYTVLSINAEELFKTVSRTYQTLMSDPGEIYRKMDMPSRFAVLNEISELSAHFHVPERLIASEAINLCKDGLFENVCEVIFTDEGRGKLIIKLNGKPKRACRIKPDPNGTTLMSLHLLLFLILAGASFLLMPAILALCLFPANWYFAKRILGRVLRFFVKTRPVLRLQMKSVPTDARTCVMIPALITDSERGRALMYELEAYGVHETDENIDFLLLGDFSDSGKPEEINDDEIVSAIKHVKDEMNARAGRKKYYYLHRKRVYYEKENLWMGRERKRGAIEDLNRLILTGENRFSAEGADADDFCGKYKYVITVDADTEMLPGTIGKLIGAIHHPINRDISVIQPRMELSPAKCKSIFSKIMGGNAGSDIYNACAADLYQDMTGQGVYSGKGIYRVSSFYEKTLEAFRENTVLSHDMMEGILTGAAYAGDIVLYEGFPKTPESFLKRLERWTRGDWQLLLYAFSRIRLTMFDRYRIFENLIRSLTDASVLLAVAGSIVTGEMTALLWALIVLLYPMEICLRSLFQALIRISLLPDTAFTQLSAIGRALTRTFVTQKNMLSWVTADQAENGKSRARYAGAITSLILLPGAFRIKTLPLYVIMAILFLFGKTVLKAYEAKANEDELTIQEYNYISGIAKDIWRYFEKYVPLGKFALPPDNVQLDPPKGAAERTSPTNIGMYILSTIGANKIGLIEASEMRARLRETASAVQRLEKWNGLLYNWYDTKSMKPLLPKYVSSVDCGNLMAAMISARNALKTEDTVLAKRYEKMIADMDIKTLYDEKRHLFKIGFDAENGKLSESCYDLLASESRILSFAAISEGKVDMENWYALSRPFGGCTKHASLISWSGTMFEYMMPFLFTPSESGTLLSNTARSVCAVQRKNGIGGVWGISESGYMGFDFEMNYQYRAFGIPSLAASGNEKGKVISPYSAMLAMMFSKKESAENLANLEKLGLRGEFGFYEAMDFSKSDTGEIVFSFMTHHQGMAFCALANVLTGNALSELFMQNANQRAFGMLLNEKAFRMKRSIVRKKKNKETEFIPEKSERTRDRSYTRVVTSEKTDAHVISTGRALAYFRSDGVSFYKRNDIYANAWHACPSRYRETLLPEIEVNSEKLSADRTVFDTGYALYSMRSKTLMSKTEITLDPQTDEMIIKLSLQNNSPDEISVFVRHAFKLAMADENSIHAHPVFSDLFIQKTEIGGNAVRYERKKRTEDEKDVYFYHSVSGLDFVKTESFEKKKATASLSGRVQLKPFEKRNVFFRIGLSDQKIEFPEEGISESDFQRARQLLSAQTRTLMLHNNLNARDLRTIGAGCIRYFESEARYSSERLHPESLWPYGISGEKPMMTVEIKTIEVAKGFKKALLVHKYLNLTGMPITLIVLLPREAEYFTPVAVVIERILSASGVRDSRNRENGVFVIKRESITQDAYGLLKANCVFYNEKEFSRECVRVNFTPYRIEAEKVFNVSEEIKRQTLLNENKFGGFTDDGSYVIYRKEELSPPIAWSNILANPEFGAIVTDRGISAVWHENSRNGRITPFDNDPEDTRSTVYLYAEREGEKVSLTPSQKARGAYAVTHSMGKTNYECEWASLRFSVTVSVPESGNYLKTRIRVQNGSASHERIKLSAMIDFLMGVFASDKKFTTVQTIDGGLYAKGRMNGVAFAEFVRNSFVRNGKIETEMEVPPNGEAENTLIIGWESEIGTHKKVASAQAETADIGIRDVLSKISFDTGKPERDVFLNGFLKYQVFASRLYAKTSLLQPGGAFGFRDQLQDLLCAMYFDREYAKKHILMCAAHQFREGDAMHWWHPPRTGVRTKISDDVLFLVYVTAKYISLTGDRDILSCEVKYLKSVPIPKGKEDIYFEAEETNETESLYDHLIRAIDKVNRRGTHDLLLMGSGDWNDGMNRVGIMGKGESVWLSEFMIYVLDSFLPYAKKEDVRKLTEIGNTLLSAVEASAWDGNWYLRAYNDHDEKIGSSENQECRIDLISQAWAVISGLQEERSKKAFESAVLQLVDFEKNVICLLSPPFTGKERDIGYISAYPAGTRENGGQYTHAATWLVKAAAKLGYAELAWRLFDMLLPTDRSNEKEKAEFYEGEPYVIAADIRGYGENKGKCGWTWYTGAAAWCFSVLLEDLMGVRLENGTVFMKALLPESMNEASVTIQYMNSTYILKADRNFHGKCEPVMLSDDGKTHVLKWPVRACTKERFL